MPDNLIKECQSRPVLAQPSPGWTFLLTDSGTCFKVDRDGPLLLHQLPDLDGCSSVAVDAAGKLFVGLYDGMMATLRDDEWAYHPADAAVLSLASTPWGLAIGDAAGSVTFRDPPGPVIASAVPGEPIVDLVVFDEGVVALGARGGLWRLGSPEGGTVSVAPLPPSEALGRPVGLFDTGNPSTVGVFSAERIALLGGKARSLKVGVRRFPQGIGAVVPFDRGSDGSSGNPPLGLLTDAGQVWSVDADLKTVAPIVLPEALGDAVGLAQGANEDLLAWTTGGALVAIGRDRSSRTLATGDVVLAYMDAVADQPDRIAVVHWHPERGVRVRLLRPEPAR
jgi:hypothetical protein